jgi:hypothetical protein
LIASESITLIVNGTCASELRPMLAGAWSNAIIAPGTGYNVEPVYDREQLIIAVLNLAFRVRLWLSPPSAMIGDAFFSYCARLIV